MKNLLLTSIVLLLLGVAHLPMGYYTLLKIVVTINAIAVMATEYKNGINFWLITFGLIAIIFNPIIPVYFNKSVWIPIDILTAIVFWVKRSTLKK